MKKSLFLLIAIVCCIFIQGCSFESIQSIEQSQVNFSEYETKLCSLAEERGYSFEEKKASQNNDVSAESEYLLKTYIICSDKNNSEKNVEYTILLKNFNGTESVELNTTSYIKDKESVCSDLDTDLLLGIINGISSYSMTERELTGFLTCSQDRYPAEKYDVNSSDFIIAKIKKLNSTEDWSCEFYLEKDFKQTFMFWGLSASNKKIFGTTGQDNYV